MLHRSDSDQSDFAGRSSELNSVVGFGSGFDDCQYFRYIKTDGARQDDQFDDVDPSLATLETRHQRLMTLESRRQSFLIQASGLPGLDQCPAEGHLSFASDRFRHASHTFCDFASG